MTAAGYALRGIVAGGGPRRYSGGRAIPMMLAAAILVRQAIAYGFYYLFWRC
jgi:hypothetical protein